MFSIVFSIAASEHLRKFKKAEQVLILNEIDAQLLNQPAVATRKRKHLRRNPLAGWELRIGNFRVFYDVAEATLLVSIHAIGVKEGNKVIIGGQEFTL